MSESSTKKSGRPFSEVWEGHMIKGAQASRGHYGAKCSYCGCSWKYGKPQTLREHLGTWPIIVKNVLLMFRHVLQKL